MKENEKNQKLLTFEDVYCIDDIVDQFREIGHLITNYQSFQKKGVRLPYGLMLVGEPGTGKTLLLNAFVNEYNINRFDYVEVSDEDDQNADNIKKLFEKARESKPAVIVIDEIDKMDLTSSFYQEMNGQLKNNGVLVIATANSLGRIPSALLRPGRFDRKIRFRTLNKETKKKMLEIKLAKLGIQYDIDLDTIVELMPFSSNAHIDTYINEALLKLNISNGTILTDELLLNAIEFVDNGYMTPIKYNEKTKNQVIIHEAGHAFVALSLLGPDCIAKINTTPNTSSSGYIQFIKSEDDMTDQLYFQNQIRIGLGGIVAEKLFTNRVTVGVKEDLDKIRNLCEKSIVEYGFERISSITSTMFDVRGQIGTESSKNSVVEKSRVMIEEAEEEVRGIFINNQSLFNELVNLLKEKPLLLKKEIIDFWKKHH